MAAPKTRTPRNMTEKTCLWCGRLFNAFRSNAKYCSDSCRAAAHKARSEPSVRERTLRERGSQCEECGSTEGKMFVRNVDGELKVLCGVHQSAESRRKFYQRTKWPPGKPGYVAEKHRQEER